MKTYKEMAESALKRIDEFETKQKKRKKTIKQVSFAVGCICVTVLAVMGIFKDKNIVTEIDIGKTDSRPILSTTQKANEIKAETTEKNSTASKKETTLKTEK